VKAVVQRVTRAGVTVDGQTVGAIGPGLLILLGVTHSDGDDDAAWLARKCAGLRVFADPAGKMNLSMKETGGGALVVSQFTLYGDGSKGNRPSFVLAADPAVAERLYEVFLSRLRTELGGDRVRTGTFGAMMSVSLENDGPVTIILESPRPTAGPGEPGEKDPG